MRRRERAASSWEATHALLSEAAAATPFARREERLLWRGSVRGSRCRARVVPILQTKLAPQLSATRVSLRVDLADSGWFGANRTAFTSLSAQCASKYLLHLRGNGYSAGLKYKLACGSLVVRMRPEPYDEFYYAALREGEHFLAVDLPSAPYISKADRELGVTAVERVTVAQLRSLFERLLQRGEEGQALAERIASAGRAFAREQLSASALHCYWRLVLEHYARLYFEPNGRSDERAV